MGFAAGWGLLGWGVDSGGRLSIPCVVGNLLGCGQDSGGRLPCVVGLLGGGRHRARPGPGQVAFMLNVAVVAPTAQRLSHPVEELIFVWNSTGFERLLGATIVNIVKVLATARTLQVLDSVWIAVQD